MKSIITVFFISMVLAASSVYAGGYSQAMPIREITFGSTGNLYIYPAQETSIIRNINHGGGTVTDYQVIQHVIPNPASCSTTNRIVMKANHPLYEYLIGRIRVGWAPYSDFKFYISSSECTLGSPTMLRMKEVVEGIMGIACNLELMYQYNTDNDPDTRYQCNIRDIRY